MCKAPQSTRVNGVTNSNGQSKLKKSKSTNGFEDGEKPETKMNRPLQMLLIATLILPWAIGIKIDLNGLNLLQRWCIMTLDTARDWIVQPKFIIACLCLSVERICYTWVWVFTENFQKFCNFLERRGFKSKEETPVDIIVKCFKINKLFQYGGFAWLYLSIGPLPRYTSIAPLHALVGLSLVLVGQILNAGIYAAIGKKGVYYGCKFNLPAPWCTGFPFNVVTAHPQYLGSVLTTFGACLLLATDIHVANGWFGLALVQALLYVYMSYVEHHL
uniref:phosphatidyl-N-methylethanolamine N-methyltransferase n=1 Tax=Aureoumbra lagunensis TaxID=44058 RepID=A0A7S3NIG1_9STRA